MKSTMFNRFKFQILQTYEIINWSEEDLSQELFNAEVMPDECSLPASANGSSIPHEYKAPWEHFQHDWPMCKKSSALVDFPYL